MLTKNRIYSEIFHLDQFLSRWKFEQKFTLLRINRLLRRQVSAVSLYFLHYSDYNFSSVFSAEFSSILAPNSYYRGIQRWSKRAKNLWILLSFQVENRCRWTHHLGWRVTRCHCGEAEVSEWHESLAPECLGVVCRISVWNKSEYNLRKIWVMYYFFMQHIDNLIIFIHKMILK